mgnify:CR=1 FL=1
MQHWWDEKQCQVNGKWIDCYKAEDGTYYERDGYNYYPNKVLKNVTNYSDKYDKYKEPVHGVHGGMRKRRSKKSKKSRKSRKSYKLKKKNVRRRKR